MHGRPPSHSEKRFYREHRGLRVVLVVVVVVVVVVIGGVLIQPRVEKKEETFWREGGRKGGRCLLQ